MGDPSRVVAGARKSVPEGVSSLRVSAGDKIVQQLASATRNRLEESKAGAKEVTFTHEIDDALPVTQYVVTKAPDGKHAYKRRVVTKARRRKERSEEYVAQKKLAVVERQRQMGERAADVQAEKARRFGNMYQKFAMNYAKTLEALVVQSQKHMLNKALDRRVAGKNAEVSNIRGRERHQFLIAQMRELPAWQMHLKKMKEELEHQEV